MLGVGELLGVNVGVGELLGVMLGVIVFVGVIEGVIVFVGVGVGVGCPMPGIGSITMLLQPGCIFSNIIRVAVEGRLTM